LARTILTDQVTTNRLRELEQGPEAMDRQLWKAFAEAQLLGVAMPEDVGGTGYGLLELCVLLEEVGRRVAPVPLLATMSAALTIAHFGTAGQRSALLPGVISGDSILTVAVQEAASRDVCRPVTTARPDGHGWLLDGEKLAVPWAPLADAVLVTADAGVFVVDASTPGLTLEAATGTDRTPRALLGLRDVRADRLGDASATAWMIDRLLAGMCALAVGVFDEAVRMTAGYLSEREQFGRPLATFQGAALRAADAYIDAQAIRVAAWSAIWRLAVGLPAADELAVAKFWVADGGQRIAHACQHLHGGMGVDVDYPIHRYFLWAKDLELTLGGATEHLLRLGESLCTSI
jgi:alkylation response protein AidB-like acyl-CoA dehydrogenase